MDQQTPLQRALIALEVLGFVALAFVGKAVLMTVAWQYAGPISLVLLLVILTGYFHMRGLSWRDFGLIKLPTLRAKLMVLPLALLTFCVVVATIAGTLGLSHVLGLAFMFEKPEGIEERWGAIEGNLPLFLLWLGIVWTAAAFGEEMFFRGYMVTRIKSVFAGSVLAVPLAVILAAALFGFGHMYYQGLRGFITTGAIALAFGTMFVLLRGNLWPMVIVHGVIDTLNFIPLYLGME